MTEKLFNSFIIHLREQLTCPMCQGFFHKPRTLPCLHSVCQECLLLLEKRSRQPTGEAPLKCPACNLDIDTSEGFNVEELPCSSYVRRLKEFVNVANSSFNVPCGTCKQRPTAVACCFDCKSLICRACLGAHNQMNSTKNHCISDLSTFDVSRLPELLQGPVFCPQPEHQDEALESFCEECLACVCEKCLHGTNSQHEDHIQKVVSLQESSDASKLRIHSALGILQEKKQACHDGIKRVDQSYRTLERRVIDARQNVHSKIEEMIRLLTNHEKEILSELDGVYKGQQAAILKHRRGLQQTLEQMRRAQEDVKRALERNLPEEISELEDPVAKHFLRLLEAAEPSSSPAKSINVDYFPDEEVSRIFTSPESQLGHMSVSYTDPSCTVVEGDTLNETTVWTGERIQFNVITRDSEGRVTYSENDCPKVNIHVDNGKPEGKVIPARIEDSMNGKYLVSYTPFQAGVYKIDVRVRTDLIKGSPFKMKAVTRTAPSNASHSGLGPGETNYRAVMPFGDPHNKPRLDLKAPRGIAVSSRGEIAVADSGNGRVQVFTAEGDFLTQFGESQEPGQGVRLINPVGVAFDIEGNLVVSDCDARQIHVLSREGNVVRTFGSETLEYPLGICATHEGYIAVCDWGSGSIKEFSSEGVLLQEFSYIPAKHYQSGTPARPYYICQQNDNYLVSLDIGCVCAFDKEGHFLHSVFDKTGHGRRRRDSLQLKEPRGLTVDSNDNLIVCDSAQHRLHMFTVDGRTVLLGTHGRDLGEFDRIQDVVAAQNGKLYVTDHGNNRVQVFQ